MKNTGKALQIERLEDGSWQLYEVDVTAKTKKDPVGPSSSYEAVFGRIHEEGYRLWHPGGKQWFPKRSDS